MASREDSKTYSQATSGLTTVDENLQQRVLASLPWNEPPFCWLSDAHQALLQNSAQVATYALGEKIWSKEARGSHYFITAGKVRLREEDTSKPLATLDVGDWFGELLLCSVDCKAVAASKEVVVVGWDATIWAQVSTPEIQAFWEGSVEEKPSSKGTLNEIKPLQRIDIQSYQTPIPVSEEDNVDNEPTPSSASPNQSAGSQKPQFQRELLATAIPQSTSTYPLSNKLHHCCNR